MRLKDKVAIVTGSGRGLGKGIAMKLAEEGAKVVIADMAAADDTVAEIVAKGGTASAFAVNVSKQEEVQALIKYAIDTYGTLDIMVNNAGINRDGMLHKMPVENWQMVIDVDLTGVFYGTQEALKHMRAQGSGRIINISSGSWLGNIGQANYAAAKAGLVGMTKSFAKEFASRNILVNAIAPGFIETPMTENLTEQVKDKIKAEIPLGKIGEPSDVANLTAFLAGDESRYITGQVISVDGGMNI